MEINPHHPVTQEMREQWHKIVALIMAKLKINHIEITVEDMETFGDGTKAVTIEPKGDVLHVRLVTMEEGMRLARKEGGLSQ
jgi:hypothetical protein